MQTTIDLHNGIVSVGVYVCVCGCARSSIRSTQMGSPSFSVRRSAKWQSNISFIARFGMGLWENRRHFIQPRSDPMMHNAYSAVRACLKFIHLFAPMDDVDGRSLRGSYYNIIVYLVFAEQLQNIQRPCTQSTIIYNIYSIYTQRRSQIDRN